MDRDDIKDSIVESRLYLLEDKAAKATVWKRATIGLTAFVWASLLTFVVGQRAHIDLLNSGPSACRDEVKAVARSNEPVTVQCDHPRHRGTYDGSTLTCACR